MTDLAKTILVFSAGKQIKLYRMSIAIGGSIEIGKAIAEYVIDDRQVDDQSTSIDTR